MKKGRKGITAIVCIIAMAAMFLAGCGKDASETEKKEEGGKDKRPVIGISMSTQTQARQLKDVEYLTKELDALGYDVMVQYAEMKPVDQSAQIDNMVASGCKGIIISAWDASALSTCVDNAAAMDIPVLCYDMLISNTENVDYYVTDNLYDCGKIQGEYVVSALGLDKGEKGPFNIEIFSGDPADSNAPYFYDGAYDAIKKYLDDGSLVVQSGQVEREVTATEGWKGLKAQERMDTILSANYGDKHVDAVLCNNDALAVGVLASLKNAGYGTETNPYPVITGMDCDIANIKAIRADEISMTVFKDNRLIAAKAAEVMDCMIKGETPEAGDVYETTFNNGVKDVTAFLIAPEVIDKNNYQEVLFDSGYYTEDMLDE